MSTSRALHKKVELGSELQHLASPDRWVIRKFLQSLD